jgi:hypothetical protein
MIREFGLLVSPLLHGRQGVGTAAADVAAVSKFIEEIAHVNFATPTSLMASIQPPRHLTVEEWIGGHVRTAADVWLPNVGLITGSAPPYLAQAMAELMHGNVIRPWAPFKPRLWDPRTGTADENEEFGHALSVAFDALDRATSDAPLDPRY